MATGKSKNVYAIPGLPTEPARRVPKTAMGLPLKVCTDPLPSRAAYTAAATEPSRLVTQELWLIQFCAAPTPKRFLYSDIHTSLALVRPFYVHSPSCAKIKRAFPVSRPAFCGVRQSHRRGPGRQDARPAASLRRSARFKLHSKSCKQSHSFLKRALISRCGTLRLYYQTSNPVFQYFRSSTNC